MNKTVYLRDDEVPVWEKARELSGDKLSPVIVAALKRFIAEKEAEAKSYERIEVRFNDSQDNLLPKIKAFYGRWIIDPDEPAFVDRMQKSFQQMYAVAETGKGNVVVYTYMQDADNSWGHKFLVYPGFDEAASDPEVNYGVREAVEKRGIPVEELDI